MRLLSRFRRRKINWDNVRTYSRFHWHNPHAHPVWMRYPGLKIDPCRPHFWYFTDTGQPPNNQVFRVDPVEGITLTNRIVPVYFDADAEPVMSYVDSGSESLSLMTSEFADKYFSDFKRRTTYITGAVQARPEKTLLLMKVPFYVYGEVYTDNFAIKDDLERVFNAPVVLGLKFVNNFMLHNLGVSWKNLFKENVRKKIATQLGMEHTHGWSDHSNTPLPQESLIASIRSKKCSQLDFSKYSRYPVFLDSHALYFIAHYFWEHRSLPEGFLDYLKEFSFIVFDKNYIQKIFDMDPPLGYLLTDLAQEIFNTTSYIFSSYEEKARIRSKTFGLFDTFTIWLSDDDFVFDDVFCLESSLPLHVYHQALKLVVLTVPDIEGSTNRIETYGEIAERVRDPRKDIIPLNLKDIMYQHVPPSSSTPVISSTPRSNSSSIDVHSLSEPSTLDIEDEPVDVKEGKENEEGISQPITASGSETDDESSVFLVEEVSFPDASSLLFEFSATLRRYLCRMFHFELTKGSSGQEVIELADSIVDELSGLERIDALADLGFYVEDLRTKEKELEGSTLLRGINELIRQVLSRTGEAVDAAKLYISVLAELVIAAFNHPPNSGPLNIVDLNKKIIFTRVMLTKGMVENLIRDLIEAFSLDLKLAGKKDYLTIMRKFSLRSLEILKEKKDRMEVSTEGIDVLHHGFFKTLDLKNKLSEKLVSFIRLNLNQDALAELRLLKSSGLSNEMLKLRRRDNRIHAVFHGTSATHIRRMITGKLTKENPLSLNLIDTMETMVPGLLEKTRRSCTNGAFIAVRNWLMRTENLLIILGRLKELLEAPPSDRSVVKGNHRPGDAVFFAGEPYRLKQVSWLEEAFKESIFGKEQAFSLDYFNNHVLQLRSLLLRLLEFQVSDLNGHDLTPVQEYFKELINHFISDQEGTLQVALPLMLDGFKRKVNGTYNVIPQNDLLAHFLKYYIQRINGTATRVAKKVLSLEARIIKAGEEGNAGLISRLQVQVKSSRAYILKLTGVKTFTSLDDLKLKRGKADAKLIILKKRLSEQMGSMKDLAKKAFLKDLAKKAFLKELSRLDPATSKQPDLKVLSAMFTPSFSRFSRGLPSQDHFLKYVIWRLGKRLREDMKSLFLKHPSEDIHLKGFILKEADKLSKVLYNVLAPPNFKSFSFSVSEYVNYKPNYLSSPPMVHVALEVGKENHFSFIIHDKKKQVVKKVINDIEQDFVYNGRLERLIKEDGAIPQMPTLSLVGRKFILNLPLLVKCREVSSKPKTPKREMGVDLGLKVFAATSVMVKGREIANYFLDGSIINKKLVDTPKPRSNARIVPQARIVGGGKLANIKLRLRNIRREGRNYQAKVKRYEAYLESRHPSLRKALKNASREELFQLKRLVRRTVDAVQRDELGLVEQVDALLEDAPKVLSDGLSRAIASVLPKLNMFELRRLKNYIWRKEQFSRTWRRIRNINTEIVHVVSHYIVGIARHHGVDVIKFENLKWSRHSKKRDTGHFLAFWQVHWFFAQVQDACELLARRHGIRFELVPAKGTSQNCSVCGEKGVRGPSANRFHCTNTSCRFEGRIVNADLNAARNIALS